MTASPLIPVQAPAGSFFGWRVVGAAFALAVFAWGIGFYGPPIFLGVLHTTRDWPVPVISAAITAHFLCGAALVVRLATLHRRFGVMATTRAGAILTGLGALGWAIAPAPWLLFLAAPVSGAGWALSSGAALNAMVSPWFDRRRPAALSMAFNGASMGGIVFSPLWVALISGLGFPVAALLVGITAAGVAWVLAGRYLGRGPAEMGLRPDGDPAAPAHGPARPDRQALAPLVHPWRDRRCVTLAAAATLGLVAQIGLVAHLFSLLAPVLGDSSAGLTMGAATACAIGGRSLLGARLPPGADRRRVAAANVGMQALGSAVLLLAGGSVPWLLLGCGLFGLGLGNVTSLPPLIAQAEFRPADVARVVALVTATSQAGYAFAPALFGLLRQDGTGGAALFAAAAAIQLAAAAVVLLGRQPRRSGRTGSSGPL
ncbi:MFS transporter [Rhodovastum atsumiense]|uniref:MFS transporter n=1 Tax=Rhodovastum atsumiense TaxID=504468 RepID=A0A5M6IMV7_9PROT|nr:MFS transporter [Rhodovastum atsumiense]KAA5608895.1 MFS transporter [Rhodovastum atsumiense]CAH2602300.1 MFS transporter [Rhodovastum atsumiense]